MKPKCTRNICAASISWKVPDFTTSVERIHLNRVTFPCVSDLTSHSISSLLVPYLDSLPFLLTPEDDFHVLPPSSTYSKMSVASLTVTRNPVHAESPTFLQIPALQVSPTSANTSASEETFFTPSFVNISVSDGEIRHIKCRSSSSKPQARHSLLKELNLASLSELTPRKRKVYECIWKMQSALCNLRYKYKAKELKMLYCVDSDKLMENLSSSLTVEQGFLTSVS
jgi:hypothetical protein